MKNKITATIGAIVFALTLTSCQNKENSGFRSDDSANSSRIINGAPETNELIYNILPELYFHSPNGDWSSCSGVYVGSNVILTAAHCNPSLYRKVNDMTLKISRVNDTVLNSGQGQLIPYQVKAEPTMFDTQFKPEKAYRDDIAAFKVSGYFDLDDRPGKSQKQFFQVKPTTLAQLPETLFASGYGRISYDDNSRNEFLHTMKLSKKSLIDCKTSDFCTKQVGPSYRQEMMDLMREEKIACFKVDSNLTPFMGDSGGPLYSIDLSGNPTVYGLFSTFWGEPPNVTAVCYTMLTPYSTWIKKQQQANLNEPFKWKQQPTSIMSKNPSHPGVKEEFEVSVPGASEVSFYFDYLQMRIGDELRIFDDRGNELFFSDGFMQAGGYQYFYSKAFKGNKFRISLAVNSPYLSKGFKVSKLSYR